MENLEHVLGALNACIGTQKNRLKSSDDRIQEQWTELRQAEKRIEELEERVEHLNEQLSAFIIIN